MKNVVAGSDSSALTAAARSRKPSMRLPIERSRTAHMSSSRFTPVSFLQDPEHDVRAGAEQPAGDPRWDEEELQRAALEEVRQAVRRVEEVQRVARGRRVEHDRVVAAVAVELVELGDRAELLRPGDRAGQLCVDEFALGTSSRVRRVGRKLGDQAVERRLGVEHDRHSSPCGPAAGGGGLEDGGVHAARLVAELLEAERVGQPPGRVDRDDRDALAGRREAERDRRRRRRLADPAGARDDADALALQALARCRRRARS